MTYLGRTLLALSLLPLLFQSTAKYKVVNRYPIGGVGGFDYISIDSSTRRLYVSHGTQVEVLDADTGKIIGTIADTPGVHGVAIASQFKHGFSSNGRENKVSMFDTTTLQLIKKIDVGKGPDGIYYEPATKRVFTNNHGTHDITALNAETGEVVGTVKMDGDGESAIIGHDGLIYVNSEEANEVVAFDPSCWSNIFHRYRNGKDLAGQQDRWHGLRHKVSGNVRGSTPYLDSAHELSAAVTMQIIVD